ncbi:recombinase family protein [Vagococcus sp. BWB3-3]|uniref:Recombinase family protein n=1 Tax=Vagococcus allomyrinae TaxID=2794353 RepID=A0A940PJX8_9ENTE|nr:recombinase family protein [Vagococcus allomyrinae]MBP1044243.1 recombinase family protein [Vagococcus allomyrinae]
MATYGYARISTTHQKFDSQEEALKAYGVDTIYTEQESGLKEDRPVLNQLLKVLQPGDTLVIFKLDRLARGMQHLLTLIDSFTKQHINFVSIENHIDTQTPTGRLLFTIMGAFAEMEATLIRERVLAGISAARKNGVKLGRPSPTQKIDQAIKQYIETENTVLDIVADCQISVPTLYKHLRQRQIPLRGCG